MLWLIIPAVSLTTALLLGRLLEKAAAEQTRPAPGFADSESADLTAREIANV
jgi:hypothetical protein